MVYTSINNKTYLMACIDGIEKLYEVNELAKPCRVEAVAEVVIEPRCIPVDEHVLRNIIERTTTRERVSRQRKNYVFQDLLFTASVIATSFLGGFLTGLI